MERKLVLKKEHIKELTMDELYAVVGAAATTASVAIEQCEKISAALGIDCGRQTCGPGCTAVSTTQTEIIEIRTTTGG